MPSGRNSLRIGVNALYLIPGGVGGTEIFLRSLLAALADIDDRNDYFLFTNLETGPRLAPDRPNFHHLTQPVRARVRPWRILWEQIGLPAAARRLGLDVLFNPGFTAPRLSPCPSVTVFHDLQHLRHPEYFRWFDRPAWRLLLGQAARHSTAVVAVSEATRRDLLGYYPIPASRVTVIPHGVDERLFDVAAQRAQGKPEPWLLCVSTLHPHKNLPRLIEVFARLRRRRPALRLVIAGVRGFAAAAIEERIAGLGLGHAVEITGWISREALYELYRRAHSCVYPSMFEGFGLPVLEAMAAGIPTACSAIESLREFAEGWALMFDPGDERQMEEALTRLLEEETLRRRLAEQGPVRARAYSWKAAAARYLELFQAVAGNRSGTVTV